MTQQNNWGQLLKKQDQYAHQQDFLKRQRNAHLKQLYKLQLDKMIYQHNSKKSSVKDQQKMMMEKLKYAQRMQIQKEYDKNKKLRSIKQIFAHDNITSVMQKRKIQDQLKQKQKNQLQKRFRKVQTEISQQKYRFIRSKEKHQHDLSFAYQQQMQYQHDKKLQAKQQDRKYSQQISQIQNQIDRRRMLDLNRIKFGYKQNPETYQKAHQIYSNKAQQRKTFLFKMSEENQRFKRQEEHKRQQQQKKHKQLRNISQYNRKSFQNKVFQKRADSVNEAFEAHKRWETISTQIQKEKYQKFRQGEQKRNQYKSMLQRQIQQQQQNKRKQRMMSTKQTKLNKSLFQGSYSPLPGMSQDYSIRKQRLIMENFLGGSQKSFQI